MKNKKDKQKLNDSSFLENNNKRNLLLTKNVFLIKIQIMI